MSNQNSSDETSLLVQWLRLGASHAGGMGLIPGRTAKILQACSLSRGERKNKDLKKIYENKKTKQNKNTNSG